MKRKHGSIAVGLALGAALVLGGTKASGKRTGVAPWDSPDGPNSYPGAPAGSLRVPDPKGLIRSKGPSGTTDNGYKITLEYVSRRGMHEVDGLLPDARPVWTAEGAPFVGKPGFTEIYSLPTTLQDKGARYLGFEVSGPAGQAYDVMGYVPEGAREGTPSPQVHGWDLNGHGYAPSAGQKGGYRTCVVVDDRAATHYRFAVATGDWTVVASGPIDGKDKSARTVLSGPWGRLVHAPLPPRPFATTKWTMEDEYGRYVLETPSLAPESELRVRYVDATGAPADLYYSRAGGPAVRAIIESRPWHWVELSNVHYDPDPKLWPKGAYWGDEGNAAVSRSGDTRLEALVRPGPGSYPGGWEPREVYAPDGKLWRAHPDPSAIRPTFSGGTNPVDPFVAAFHLDETKVSWETPAHIAGFASTSPTPGQGLSDLPAPWRASEAMRPFGQLLFARPKTPYVQFAVRYGSDRWTKAGEIPRPSFDLPLVPPEEQASYRRGSMSNIAFTVCLRSTGHADLYYHPRVGESVMKRELVRWEPDREARLVARLRSGVRVVMPHNSLGISNAGASQIVSRDASFNLTADSDALYEGTFWDGKSVKTESRRVLFSDVAAFEIETRAYGDPVYLVAKLPPP